MNLKEGEKVRMDMLEFLLGSNTIRAIKAWTYL